MALVARQPTSLDMVLGFSFIARQEASEKGRFKKEKLLKALGAVGIIGDWGLCSGSPLCGNFQSGRHTKSDATKFQLLYTNLTPGGATFAALWTHTHTHTQAKFLSGPTAQRDSMPVRREREKERETGGHGGEPKNHRGVIG